jgi:hypothetical protein
MLSSYEDNLSAKLAITAPTISPDNHTSSYQGETHTTWSVQIGHHMVPSHVYESNSHANDTSLTHISSPTRPHISMLLTRRASGIVGTTAIATNVNTAAEIRPSRSLLKLSSPMARPPKTTVNCSHERKVRSLAKKTTFVSSTRRWRTDLLVRL